MSLFFSIFETRVKLIQISTDRLISTNRFHVWLFFRKKEDTHGWELYLTRTLKERIEFA